MRFFRDQGFEARHVFDSMQHDASDEHIFAFARENDLIVVTKGDDFARRSDALGAPPQILWLRFGNCRNQALLAAMVSAWPNIQPALQRGERIVEVRAS